MSDVEPVPAEGGSEPEATQAADAAEEQPTQLGDPAVEGETQSIHAWSLAGENAEADVTSYQQRGWKVPIIVAATALISIGAAGAAYIAWPHHAAPPKPSSASIPPPPPLPTDPDQRFIALYKQRGYVDNDPMERQQLIGDAHVFVDDITSGATKEDEIQKILKASPQGGLPHATTLANTMMDAYQPVPGIHYVETETYPDGKDIKSDWYIASCGDDCAYIAGLGKAHLIDGEWTLDGTGGVTCEQGGDIPDAIAYHYTWNPHTLVGTTRVTNQVAVCDNPQGYVTTNKLVLAPG